MRWPEWTYCQRTNKFDNQCKMKAGPELISPYTKYRPVKTVYHFIIALIQFCFIFSCVSPTLFIRSNIMVFPLIDIHIDECIIYHCRFKRKTTVWLSIFQNEYGIRSTFINIYNEYLRCIRSSVFTWRSNRFFSWEKILWSNLLLFLRCKC